MDNTKNPTLGFVLLPLFYLMFFFPKQCLSEDLTHSAAAKHTRGKALPLRAFW